MRALFLGLLTVSGLSCSTMPPGMDAGVACDLKLGTPTPHSGTITANETWTAAASPHVVDFELRVNATVTIEPCATVQLGEGARIIVGTSTQPGKLVASSAAITAKDASKPWGALSVDVQGSLDFTDVVISDGANPASAQNGGGAVLVYGVGSNTDTVTRALRFINVTISRSKGHAVNLQRMSGFTADSRNLKVLDSGGTAAPYPILVEAGAVGTLPSVTFTNTASPDVLIEPRGSMPSDTFKNIGAPYRVNGPLRVHGSADGPASTLTIEAGVTLKFDDSAGSGMVIGTSNVRQGLLVVNGTAGAPVTFTSGKASPAPGDWQHIHFRNTPASGNKMDFAVVAYAGAFSGLQGYGCGPIENDASVILTPDSGRPSSAFITNTTIRDAAGDTALLLGWVSDDSGPDFTATNTFTNVPACKVSRWRNATGTACPGSVSGSPVCLL